MYVSVSFKSKTSLALKLKINSGHHGVFFSLRLELNMTQYKKNLKGAILFNFTWVAIGF